VPSRLVKFDTACFNSRELFEKNFLGLASGGVAPGLPDGLFSNQKYQFWYILSGLRLVNVYIVYGHLEYFMEIWDILGPFGIF
jgi:hypothetical protein